MIDPNLRLSPLSVSFLSSSFEQKIYVPILPQLLQTMINNKFTHQIGSIISNLVTGYIINYTENYSLVFYLFGIVGILWNISFVRRSDRLLEKPKNQNKKLFFFQQFLVYNTPFTHPRISSDEKEYLRAEVGELVETKSFLQIPWTSMLTSPAVIALIIAEIVR